MYIALFYKVTLKSVLKHFTRFVEISPVGMFAIFNIHENVTCKTATKKCFIVKYRNFLFYNFGIISVN